MKPLKAFCLLQPASSCLVVQAAQLKPQLSSPVMKIFQPGPDGGVDLVWARIGLRDAQRLKSKLDDYDSVVIDREAGNKDFSTMIDSLDDAKDAINYWVERLGDTLQNIDDA